MKESKIQKLLLSENLDDIYLGYILAVEEGDIDKYFRRNSFNETILFPWICRNRNKYFTNIVIFTKQHTSENKIRITTNNKEKLYDKWNKEIREGI